MTPQQVLQQIQAEGIFTSGLTIDVFISDLCKRYARMYEEILPTNKYEYIVSKLKEKEIIAQ